MITDRLETVAMPETARATARATTRATTRATAGARRNILLVEDEAIVALMLEDMLDDMGYATTGPAMSVTSAMALIDEGGIDGAILDINIGGGSSEPIAERLVAQGVPFAFATGYTSAPRNGFKEVRLLQKPYSEQDLKNVVDGFFA